MKKILLIDDDRELCEEIRDLLRAEKCHVVAAYDGSTAHQLIQKDDYSLLVLDLKIPGMNGFELLKIAKEKNRNLKVIILTGSPLFFQANKMPEKVRTHSPEEKRRLELADKIINKPFDAENFLNDVKSFIGRYKKA